MARLSDALAAAGLADEAERLAGQDLEAHAVDRVDGGVLRPEADDEVLDAQERSAVARLRGGRRPCGRRGAAARGRGRVGRRRRHAQRLLTEPRGSSASRSPSPMKLIASTEIAIAAPGAIHTQGFSRIVPDVDRAVEHLAPAGLRRLDAEAEEAQAGLGDDRVRHAEAREDDQRTRDVGQDVPADDPPIAGADARGRRACTRARAATGTRPGPGAPPAASPAGR